MKKLLLLICICCILASCKKDKTSSSELVTVNGQTFGCRVNGKPFMVDKWDYGNNIPPVRIRFWYSNFSFPSVQVIGEKENSYVEIWLNSPFVLGNRSVKIRTRPIPIYSNPGDYCLYQTLYPNKEFITNDTLGGVVNILSIDTLTQKIEGRFGFTGTDRKTGEKVTVTNGYFKNF